MHNLELGPNTGINKLLSVCFLSFNDCEALHKTINSVGQYLHEHKLIDQSEFIVLDNHSMNDRNRPFIDGMLKQGVIDQAILLDYNSGQGGGMKKLFEAASCPYILWMQSDWILRDDVMQTDFIRSGMNLLDKYSLIQDHQPRIGLVQLKHKENFAYDKEIEPGIFLLQDNGFGNFSFQIHLTKKDIYNDWGPSHEYSFLFSCKNGRDEGSLAEYECGQKFKNKGYRSAIIDHGQFEHIRQPNILKEFANSR